MNNPIRILFFAVLLAIQTAAIASAWGIPLQHQNSQFGFRFDPPHGWKEVPVSVEGGWFAGKYQPEKEDYYENLTVYDSQMPTLLVLLFTPVGGAKSPDFTNPHENYVTFLRKEVTPTPRFEMENKGASVGGIAVSRYSLTYTSKTNNTETRSPRRVLTSVYHLPGVDVALQFEILESVFKKREVSMEDCLRSFKQTPKAGSKGGSATAKAAESTIEDLLKLTPEERKIRRTSAAQAAYTKAKASAGEGWTVMDEKRFLVIYHSDQKFALKVVALGNAILEWLDKNFDYIGKNEFVRKPILRICASSNEHRAMQSEGSWWCGTNLEIITYKDESDGVASYAFHNFSKSVLTHWLNERDIDLAMAMPDWIREGLDRAFEYAWIENGILKFTPNIQEYMNARVSYRDKQHVSLKQLFVPPAEGDVTPPVSPTPDQKSCAVRFFLYGMGQKDSKYKEAFKNYVKNCKSAVLEVRKAGVGAAGGPGKDDYKNRREFWQRSQHKLQLKAAEQTFANWKESDWKAIEHSYLEFLTVTQ